MKTIFQLFNGLKQPNSQQAEVLYHLIKKGSATMKDFYFGDFRKIMCVLNDKGVKVSKTELKGVTRYGNTYMYKRHNLLNRDFAIDLYKKMTE